MLKAEECKWPILLYWRKLKVVILSYWHCHTFSAFQCNSNSKVDKVHLLVIYLLVCKQECESKLTFKRRTFFSILSVQETTKCSMKIINIPLLNVSTYTFISVGVYTEHQWICSAYILHHAKCKTKYPSLAIYAINCCGSSSIRWTSI